MAINAGEIFVRFSADNRQAIREFARFQGSLRNVLITTRSQVRDIEQSLNGFRLLAGTGLGAIAFKLSSDFDRAITNVRAITKESEDQFQRTRAAAIVLASEYGKAADEVGGALFQIVSAGKRGAEAMQTLETATKLSKAGLVETSVATDVLIGSLNTFGFAGDQAEDVAGKLIGTVDRGILTFEELATKLGQVSPVAKASGVEFEELLGILALLTRNGVQFAQAVTQARGAIIKLVAPGKEARVEIERLLGTTIDASLATNGYIGTLEKLINASDGSTATFKKLFEDTEAIQGVAAIASAGIGQLREDISALQNAGAGTLNQTLEIQSKSLAQISAELKNLIQNRIVAFFENNRDAIIGTTQAIVDFLRENERLVDLVITGTVALAGFTAAGLLLKGVLIATDAILTIANGALGIFTGLVTTNTAATVANASAVGANTVAVSANTASVNVNSASVGANQAVRTSAIVTTNAHTAALALQNRALIVGSGGFTSAASSTRIYVQNTANAAAATGGFSAILRALFPTFSKIPALLKSAATAFGAAATAAAGFLLPLIAIVSTAVLFFRAGRTIGRAISGNTKAWEEQNKILKEVEERHAAVARISVNALGLNTTSTDKATESTKLYNQTMRDLTQALLDNNRGIEGSADRVKELNAELDKLRPIAQQSTDTLKTRLIGIESQIRSAAEATGLLGEGYQGAFDESGRLLAGFGTNKAEIDALVAKFGESTAQEYVKEIKNIKDELTGAADATRAYAEAQKQAQTNTGILGRIVAEAGDTVDKYEKTLGKLVDRSRGLAQGDIANTFDNLATNVREAEDAIEELEDQISRAQAGLELAFKGVDPKTIEAAYDRLEELQAQYEQAIEADSYLRQAQRNAIKKLDDEIKQDRLEALDDVTQKEIDGLRLVGREREADERAAAFRRDQSIRKVEEALDEELKRRKQINDLISDDTLTTKEREALQLTLQRSDALIKLYNEQKSAIREAYDAELAAIDRNGLELRKRLEDETKRRKLLALNEEKTGQARIAIQARINGDVQTELAARQRIAEIELEILGVKGLQADEELKLIDAVRERLQLFRDEIQSILNAGGTLEDAANAARDAQRDIGGASRVQGAREGIRANLDQAQTEAGIQETQKAYREALEKETQILLRQRKEAEKNGNKEVVQEIDQRLKEIRELWNIFLNEIARRLQEIGKEDASRNRNGGTQPPSQPGNVPAPPTQPTQPPTVPGVPVIPQLPQVPKINLPGTPPGLLDLPEIQTPQVIPPTIDNNKPFTLPELPQIPKIDLPVTPVFDTVPKVPVPETNGPAVSQQLPQSDSGAGDTSSEIKKAKDELREQSKKTQAEVGKAAKEFVSAATDMTSSVRDLGNTVVDAFANVNKKMAEVVKQLNSNTSAIQSQSNEIQRLQIEGRK